ncbi:MAG: chromosome segregation protein SMC, partial [Pseudomonadota bacterium]
NPICPICKVPIDKALAEGCGISTATCDLAALQTEIAKLRDDIQAQGKEISVLERRKPSLKSQVAVARQKLDRLDQAVSNLETALNKRSTAIRDAQRAVDLVEAYADLMAERTKVSESLGDMEQEQEKTKDELAAHRSSVAGVIRDLSTHFDAVLRELVPGEIKGTAKLDGNGLALKVEMGGDRSTAAIESLKVVAFDLAALVMTIEGKTSLADFVVHDSPREADLGESIYFRLFEFARKLERFGPNPLFQYIISTTTKPPEEFCSDPWLRLTIRGSPAEERLLGVDL